MERVKRIELSQSAWKAEVLPLNYTRKSNKPGNVLLLHVCTTLGAKELNFCVRDGNRCGLFAIVTGLGSFFFAGISFDLPKPDTFYHTLESIQVRKLLPMRACSPF